MDYALKLSKEFSIRADHSANIITLIDDGNTIPFIARYRKEATGSCDDQVLREFHDRLKYLRNLDKRKQEIADAITEQGKMTDEIALALAGAETLTEAEDIYRPYKQKRKTRASVATEKGLAPLADFILEQGDGSIEEKAKEFINEEKGVDSVESARKFLKPSLFDLHDPFLFGGMKDAVNRIKMARENGETVVIYGDYDADGISAVTVLYRSLKLFGIDAIPIIPERQNGYGLSVEMISSVLDEYFPDLIITVDCGISAVKEVEELQDLGVDVIVTDHHEFPSEIPDTIIVSTKTKNQEYTSQYGVALRATSLVYDYVHSRRWCSRALSCSYLA